MILVQIYIFFYALLYEVCARRLHQRRDHMPNDGQDVQGAFHLTVGSPIPSSRTKVPTRFLSVLIVFLRWAVEATGDGSGV